MACVFRKKLAHLGPPLPETHPTPAITPCLATARETRYGRYKMGEGGWEKGDGRRGMGEGRWEKGDGRREMGDWRRETGDVRKETGDIRWEKTNRRHEMGEE